MNRRAEAISVSPAKRTSEQGRVSSVESIRSHLVLILVSEAIALDVLALPARLSFESHLLRDQAQTLGLDYLLSHGYVLNRDFGYQYGLVGLAVQKFWFTLFPSNNMSIQPVFILISVLLAAGMARFVRTLRIGVPGIALLMVALPLAIQPGNAYFSLEGALLTNALAEHAEGKRERALALAVLSCFVVPSMGYVYGLALLFLTGFELWRRSDFTFRKISESLVPAAEMGAALALLLSAAFGFSTVITTLLPLRGMQAYRALKFGLFSGSVGRLLYFPGVRIGYYFGSPVAFWLAGSLWLIASGIKAGIAHLTGTAHSLRDSASSQEMVLTCAALHLAFVTGFYGPPSSWTYYA